MEEINKILLEESCIIEKQNRHQPAEVANEVGNKISRGSQRLSGVKIKYVNNLTLKV